MEIILNGEPLNLTDGCTVQDLVDQLKLEQQRLAVEVNLEIVPRSRYGEYSLNEGDKVEVVHAIGGG
ncbi:MAG TPA: sulfur carrier protein ThiS [Gammaproteobacteria bacterium]